MCSPIKMCYFMIGIKIEILTVHEILKYLINMMSSYDYVIAIENVLCFKVLCIVTNNISIWLIILLWHNVGMNFEQVQNHLAQRVITWSRPKLLLPDPYHHPVMVTSSFKHCWKINYSYQNASLLNNFSNMIIHVNILLWLLNKRTY